MLNPYREKVEKLRVTSPYAMRNGVMHKGVDLVSDGDKALVAVGSGVIGTSTIVTDKTNLTWQWGNYVRLDLDTGERVYYCHMSQRIAVVGQRVNKGDVIGIEGTTGYSSGNHLHLEIRPKGTSSNALNAAMFIGIENETGKVKALDYGKLIQEACGFEPQTMAYYNAYKYSDDFWRKLFLYTPSLF